MAAIEKIETRIDLPAKAREKTALVLNQQLADTFDLYSQIKQAHWNVKGPEFFQLHKFYDVLAVDLQEHADLIAERIMALGGIALGTVRMAAQASRLPEFPAHAMQSMSSVEVLAVRFASLVETTRSAISTASDQGDETTSNMLQEISAALDKDLWLLESHLQK
jgi:starvation-inducible DNA-binding protein